MTMMLSSPFKKILWVDDVRPCPNDNDYTRAWSVDGAKMLIMSAEIENNPFDLLDLDSDASIFAEYGGDYWKLLDWLEATGRNYPIRIHSMNVVARERMRLIIEHNHWREVR